MIVSPSHRSHTDRKMISGHHIRVEVAYAEGEHQVVLVVDVPVGCTVAEAVRLSGILERYPGIDLRRNKVGIYGHHVKLSRVLTVNDRIEIYRSLRIDPKEARRRRTQMTRRRRLS